VAETIAGYPVHPAALLFPLMEEAELQQLADDIRAHGQREPVVLLNLAVLDGRNRLLACERAGIQPLFTHRTDGQVPDAVAYALAANIYRRHLTPSQRAAIAAEASLLVEEQRARERQREHAGTAPGRARNTQRPRALSDSAAGREVAAAESLAPEDAGRQSGEGTGNPPSVPSSSSEPPAKKGKAAERVAAIAGVGARTVERAKAVKESAPELLDQVKAGDLTLRAAEEEVRKRKNPHAASRVNDGDPEKNDRFTPRALVEQLHEEFHFTVDVCGHPKSPASKLIGKYWTKENDARTIDHTGQTPFFNPPFDELEFWVEFIHQLIDSGKVERAVLVMPASRTEQILWQRWIEPFRLDRGGGGIRTRFLGSDTVRGARTRYGNPEDPEGKDVGSPGWATVVVIWQGPLRRSPEMPMGGAPEREEPPIPGGDTGAPLKREEAEKEGRAAEARGGTERSGARSAAAAGPSIVVGWFWLGKIGQGRTHALQGWTDKEAACGEKVGKGLGPEKKDDKRCEECSAVLEATRDDKRPSCLCGCAAADHGPQGCSMCICEMYEPAGAAVSTTADAPSRPWTVEWRRKGKAGEAHAYGDPAKEGRSCCGRPGDKRPNRVETRWGLFCAQCEEAVGKAVLAGSAVDGLLHRRQQSARPRPEGWTWREVNIHPSVRRAHAMAWPGEASTLCGAKLSSGKPATPDRLPCEHCLAEIAMPTGPYTLLATAAHRRGEDICPGCGVTRKENSPENGGVGWQHGSVGDRPALSQCQACVAKGIPRAPVSEEDQRAWHKARARASDRSAKATKTRRVWTAKAPAADGQSWRLSRGRSPLAHAVRYIGDESSICHTVLGPYRGGAGERGGRARARDKRCPRCVALLEKTSTRSSDAAPARKSRPVWMVGHAHGAVAHAFAKPDAHRTFCDVSIGRPRRRAKTGDRRCDQCAVTCARRAYPISAREAHELAVIPLAEFGRLAQGLGFSRTLKPAGKHRQAMCFACKTRILVRLSRGQVERSALEDLRRHQKACSDKRVREVKVKARWLRFQPGGQCVATRKPGALRCTRKGQTVVKSGGRLWSVCKRHAQQAMTDGVLRVALEGA
jgi:ParB-like chromosome segregation protein Spo0J